MRFDKSRPSWRARHALDHQVQALLGVHPIERRQVISYFRAETMRLSVGCSTPSLPENPHKEFPSSVIRQMKHVMQSVVDSARLSACAWWQRERRRHCPLHWYPFVCFTKTFRSKRSKKKVRDPSTGPMTLMGGEPWAFIPFISQAPRICRRNRLGAVHDGQIHAAPANRIPSLSTYAPAATSEWARSTVDEHRVS